MRQLLACIVFSCVLFSAPAQYFSGELTYSIKIIPKKANLNVDSMLNLQPGTQSSYLIRDHYYKSTYYREGKQTYSYTYHDDTKRMYDDELEKDYITFRDSRKGNSSRIRSIIYKDSIKVIAGHPCFMVERIYESHISKTYYTQDLKIDPETFQGHQVGDWYNQIKEVNGSLSLGTISEYATHVEEHLVSKINERKVGREEFNLRAKPIVASYSALDKNVTLNNPTNETLNCYREKIAAASKFNIKEKVTVYVSFIISPDGSISHVEPYEPDETGLHVIAVDIILNCGLKFTSGEIAGEPVSSLTYFPIEFNP
jgi:hypothetical protein